MSATVTSPRQSDVVETPERSTPTARFRGRWRVALRYGARDARRNKGRTALVAIMVMLPVAVGTLVTAGLYGVQSPAARVQGELGRSIEASLMFEGPGYMQNPLQTSGMGGPDEPGATYSAAEVTRRLQDVLPAGATLHPWVSDAVAVSTPRLTTSGAAAQLDVSAPGMADAIPLADGALPRTGQVAVSRSVAADLHLAVGDTVTLGFVSLDDQKFSATVSAVLGRDASRLWDVLLPGSGPLTVPDELDLRTGLGMYRWYVTGAPITWDDVVRINEVGASVTSRAVFRDPPPDDAVPLYHEVGATTAHDLVEMWSPLVAVIVIALLEAVLLIGPAFAVGARRSTRSLALVAANGGDRKAVRALVHGTGVVVGTLASLCGVVLGLAGSVSVLSVSHQQLVLAPVPWLPVAGIFLVGVLLATTAAWLPARGAARADVVAVLSGRRGEPAHRRWPAVVGAVLGVAGFGAAVAAGVAAQPLLVAAGVVVGELGLVLACGGIVALLGRLAGHLSLSWRFALRDAARNRSRTVPAVAAVLVAVAGATGGLVYAQSQSLSEYRNQSIEAAPGTLMIAPEAWPSSEDQLRTLDEHAVRTITDIVTDVIPEAGPLTEVRVVRSPAGAAVDMSLGVDLPATSDVAISGGYGQGSVPGPIVDDGSLVDVLGIPDPDAAREALRQGKVVVGPLYLGPTGVADLTVWDQAAGAGADTPAADAAHVRAAAVAVGEVVGPTASALPLVPPAFAEQHDLPVSVGGLVATPASRPSAAQVATLNARLQDEFGESDLQTCVVCAAIASPPRSSDTDAWLTTLLIAGGGGLLALAAAWIAAALAATESRHDLAVLTAVGGAPATRKRVVAAQAGTIVVIGAVLGALSGIALGAAFVLRRRFMSGQDDVTWSVVVPWPALAAMLVGLPLLAVGAAWLVTRGRLTMTRRLTD